MTPTEAIEILERLNKYTINTRLEEEAIDLAIAAIKAQAGNATLDDLAAQQGVAGPTDLGGESVEFEPVHVPTDAELLFWAMTCDLNEDELTLHFDNYTKAWRLTTLMANETAEEQQRLRGNVRYRYLGNGKRPSLELEDGPAARAILTPPYLAWRKEGDNG